MKKIKLEPFEIQLAADVAARRFVENQKMGRTFGHGYKGSVNKKKKKNVSGACAELPF